MTIVEATPRGGHDALAADGAIVRIRPVLPADCGDLTDLYGRTSKNNLYWRFLRAGRAGIEPELDRLTRADDGDHVVAIATERDRLIGAPPPSGWGVRVRPSSRCSWTGAPHGRGMSAPCC